VTWRWCFYLNLPLGGVALLILLVMFRTPAAAMPQQATILEKFLQMDPLGVVLINAAFVPFLLAMQWGGITKAWASADVIGCLVAACVITLAFAACEWFNGSRAMMVGRLLKSWWIIVLALFNFLLAGSYFIFVYYLPIYFQAIGGLSAAASAVRNLSLIVGSSLFGIVAGVLLASFGYFHPFLWSGSALACIGAGLLCTLTIDLDTGKYVGYQLLLGVGCGLCLQVPVMVGQAFALPQDIAAVTAILLFFQTTGGTILISAGQSIFTNQILNYLGSQGNGISGSNVINVGADDLRSVFDGAELEVIKQAYLYGLRSAWILGTVCAGAAFIVSFLTRVRSIKAPPKGKPAAN